MGTSSGSHFNNQLSPTMLPPRQQVRSTPLHTSLSLVPSYTDQVHESPTESASSRDTWQDPLILSKKDHDNNIPEHSVIRHTSNSDKMSIRDVCRERVDLIAERMQNLPHEFLEKLKTDLRVLIEGSGSHQHKEEYISLQKTVMERRDLTETTLMLAHRGQLEILVAVKTGIQAFLHPTVSLSQPSLIDIFLYKKCRNISCGSQIPADNCSCEICSKRNGFCNLCMCVICTKFDFEVNTCRWIGCDVCSHWTHTDCAIRNGQIGTGSPVSTGAGSGQMLFRCRACLKTSELFGWVKDVFYQCARLWDREGLVKELEFVRRIFYKSEEVKGRKLYLKCEELVEKLKTGLSDSVGCNSILSFFQEMETDSETLKESEEGRFIPPQEAFNRIADVVHEAIKKMELVEEEKVRLVKKARLALEACDQELKDKAREMKSLNLERQKKRHQVDELESIVRLKQAEADMFDLKASEARREGERLQRIALAKVEKSEDDYANSYLKQRLKEAEVEKQYLFEKIRLEESSSRVSQGGDPMYNKIQDLLRNM